MVMASHSEKGARQDLHPSNASPRGRLARRWSGAAVLVAAAAVLLVTGVGRSSSAPVKVPPRCDRAAADADSLKSSFDAAAPGEIICLQPGDYGTFEAGSKPGPVTVRSESGATARMALSFDSVSNVRITSVTVTSARITGRSRDVMVDHSRFTGLAFIDAGEMEDANIRLRANRHVDIDTCASCFQGRVQVDGDSGRPSGVEVSDSLFAGGNSDGIRAGTRGLQVLRNEFTGLYSSAELHTDPIQIYGGKQIVIRGNFIHDNDVSAGIMMADGGEGNVVEDNVISGPGQTWAMTWNSDDGSIIRHNTFADGECDFDKRCGTVSLGSKAGASPGRGTVIRDNVLGGVGAEGATFEADHNLSRDPLPGAFNIIGLPTYAASPSSYSGHRLAAGSLGSGSASDGRNPGIR